MNKTIDTETLLLKIESHEHRIGIMENLLRDAKQVLTLEEAALFMGISKSSLYKMDGAYYLILDFTGFAKEEMRPFAFGTIEYDDAHYSDQGHIAHIREQGICIMKKQALEMLMQL